jgi:hypothetical protein
VAAAAAGAAVSMQQEHYKEAQGGIATIQGDSASINS